jgi:hypothetical protein
MNKVTDKIPLKNKTALNHLRTLKRATEIVGSWPKWKQDSLVYRERPGRESPAKRKENEEPQRRSA